MEALEDSSYARIRNRVGKIQGEEDYHLEHAQNWLERLAEEEQSGERVQTALDRLWPHAQTIFAPTDEEVEERIDDLGLRTKSLAEMREEWRETVVPYLEDLGLSVDAGGETDLPEVTGRNLSHTDDWDDLWEEFTRTYRELDRSEATRIMKDPDEVA